MFLLALCLTQSALTYQVQEDPCVKCWGAERGDQPRSFALLVGINNYAASKLNNSLHDLDAAVNDAVRFERLLANDFGFEQTCLLLDDQATLPIFKQTFDCLVKRLKSKDRVVIFFAGHGSSKRERLGGDEVDSWDEVLLFHDARLRNSPGNGTLVDDDFNGMLARLYQQTTNLTVILDACTSGTMDRDPGKQVRNRYAMPLGWEPGIPMDGKRSSSGFSEAVFISAARDGDPAKEIFDTGALTGALLKVFGEMGPKPLTYASAEYQVRRLVTEVSPGQVPVFQGNLERFVFDEETRRLPTHVIVKQDQGVWFAAGAPLPGFSQGAVLAVYDQSADWRDLRDRKVKGWVRILAGDAQRWALQIMSQTQGMTFTEGDIAVLETPGRDFRQVQFRFRPENEPDGTPIDRIRQVRRELASMSNRGLIRENASVWDVEVTWTAKGFGLCSSRWSPHNRPWYAPVSKYPTDVLQRLKNMATLRALAVVKGGGQGVLHDQDSLRVRIIPAHSSTSQADITNDGHGNFQVPLNGKWQVEVTVSNRTTMKNITVGVLAISPDGNAISLPMHNRVAVIPYGKKKVFETVFTASPPVDSMDRIIVIGSTESGWSGFKRLLDDTTTLKGDESPDPVLTNVFQPSRTPRVGTSTGSEPWAVSRCTVTTRAHPDYADTALFQQLDGFDLRPYLPDDQNSTLHQLLRGLEQTVETGNGDLAWVARNLKLLSRRGARSLKGLSTGKSVTGVVTAKNRPIQAGDLAARISDNALLVIVDPVKGLAWGPSGTLGPPVWQRFHEAAVKGPWQFEKMPQTRPRSYGAALWKDQGDNGK